MNFFLIPPKRVKKLHEECPYLEFLWTLVFPSRTDYGNLISKRIHSKYWKIRTRKTPNMGTFYSVLETKCIYHYVENEVLNSIYPILIFPRLLPTSLKFRFATPAHRFRALTTAFFFACRFNSLSSPKRIIIMEFQAAVTH